MREHKGRSLLEFSPSYTVIDIETTGIDPRWDSIIEVGAIRVRNNEIIDTFSSLINIDVPLNSFITELTGITNEQLQAAPDPVSVLTQLHNFIGEDILVGHNIHFDINFLYDNFVKYLQQPLGNNFIDTLRFSKRYLKHMESYSLSNLSMSLNIPSDGAHRALADCTTTMKLYTKLQELALHPSSTELALLNTLSFGADNPFYGKRIAVKGLPQLYSYSFMKAVAEKSGAKLSDVFYSSCDYIIFSHFTYQKYKRGDMSEKFEKADILAESGSLTILSESEWCQMLGLPVPKPQHPSTYAVPTSKNVFTERTEFDETHPLYGKVCVFTGTLERMTRKEAMQALVDLGGIIGDSVTKKTNFLILGNNEYNPLVKDGKSSKQKKAEALKLAGQDIEIISEAVFYDMISEI